MSVEVLRAFRALEDAAFMLRNPLSDPGEAILIRRGTHGMVREVRHQDALPRPKGILGIRRGPFFSFKGIIREPKPQQTEIRAYSGS